jgi:uncharacterized protein YegJ (DUF2314 family)
MKTTFLIFWLAASLTYAQPPDKPLYKTGDEAADAQDRVIKPLIAKARATYPQAKARFLKGLPAGEGFYVMKRLSTQHGRVTEDVFVHVLSIEGRTIHGVIDSEITLVKPHQKGERISFPEKDIMDWTILHAGGREEGNVIGKYIDAHRK